MSSRENAIIFDDGSLESKVLQFELKTSYDLVPIKVEPYTHLETWMQNVDTKIQKIFLHFCYEDYITRDIRTEMAEIMHKNPNLRIIAWYEQATKDSIKHRADNYGIKKMTVDDKPEPFIYVGTQSPEEIEKVKEQIKSTETIIAKSKDKFHWVEFEKKREEYKDKRRRKKKE